MDGEKSTIPRYFYFASRSDPGFKRKGIPYKVTKMLFFKLLHYCAVDLIAVMV